MLKHRVYFVLATVVLPRLIHSLPLQSQLEDGRGEGDAVGEGVSRDYYLFISAVLVLLGGVFAGLTLGLMGQDEIYLKVISSSGTAQEQRLAKKVLGLINRGKHWVLVTLLLSNVITNETLPIVLDRCLGGGWQAVFSSTVLIVVFGEIIPQSVCVKYGLQVGAFFAPFVLVLMYVMYPVAYPIAALLDYMLGEDHGTMYKKSGLKTLVMLHRTMGVERLSQDEVTIISAVLDLKEKKVREIMTPIENVFTISADTVLDEKHVAEIFDSGFSRIPIYLPNEPTNFIGMLLVRILISYDPEDCLPVSHFPLATLPETSPSTSCLNILNYFQEGKSHMCVVSEDPGSSMGAIGVLTLEDVIEELIGEEIVDESDVFVDIHQKIIRAQPGPLSKRHVTSYLHHLYTSRSRSDSPSAEDSRQPLEVRNDHLACNANSPHPLDAAHNHMALPSNPASNPLKVNKPYVTIKKPNYNLPANEEHLYRKHLDMSQRAVDHTEMTGQPTQVTSALAPATGAHHSSPELASEDGRSSSHSTKPNAIISSSYKSTKNGIVESVITVKGVPKTIIEATNNWDETSRLVSPNHVGSYTEGPIDGPKSHFTQLSPVNSRSSTKGKKSASDRSGSSGAVSYR
ncbi:hypothetical protein HG536_0G02700 [Torulaspora globosa]|uniref:CNNM transmembrane domain-containing protein n=1 Tax=Torulaspora globosa TaxID=48254 RepID=A0A7G3ZLM3_9SACH|nr:uncharacterized protein HG536_0G02700 [Torulaspora globosa]QLL34409.1 hypothetical protein HG536_0G02700 [Torulaspora globosa]